MHRLAPRAVMDLMAAACAVGDDEVVRPGLAHCRQQRQLAQHVPGAKLLLLAGVGHHAYTQEPAEWATLVADFLDGASSRPEAPSFELNA